MALWRCIKGILSGSRNPFKRGQIRWFKCPSVLEDSTLEEQAGVCVEQQLVLPRAAAQILRSWTKKEDPKFFLWAPGPAADRPPHLILCLMKHLARGNTCLPSASGASLQL
ncbi:hypothetical protein GE061_011640 [Apolygus lucorum]|uniref:Uncharacterized protein n=1 Tax=Apolygus lucorum TaxID=248454 RepID=A0A6A4K8D7_APOLU|nr:hypothetical protein GE061_011640 [Apolygus lucorum]